MVKIRSQNDAWKGYLKLGIGEIATPKLPGALHSAPYEPQLQ